MTLKQIKAYNDFVANTPIGTDPMIIRPQEAIIHTAADKIDLRFVRGVYIDQNGHLNLDKVEYFLITLPITGENHDTSQTY